jgi:hypothetical protein
MRRDFSRRLHNGQDAWVYAAYSKEGESLIKTRGWMEYDKKPSRITNFFWPEKIYSNQQYHQNIGMSFRKDCHHWLPVNGEYPKTIPTVPTYDSKLMWYPVAGGSASFTVAERINFVK